MLGGMPDSRHWKTICSCWLRLLWGLQPYSVGAKGMETICRTMKGNSVPNYDQKHEYKCILQTVCHNLIPEYRLNDYGCVRLSESDLQLG